MRFDVDSMKAYLASSKSYFEVLGEAITRLSCYNDAGDDATLLGKADSAFMAASAFGARGCVMVDRGDSAGWDLLDDAWSCYNAELFLRVKVLSRAARNQGRVSMPAVDKLRLRLLLQLSYGTFYEDGSGQVGGLRLTHEELAGFDDPSDLTKLCSVVLGDLVPSYPKARSLADDRGIVLSVLDNEPIDLPAPYGYFPVEQARVRQLLNVPAPSDMSKSFFVGGHVIKSPNAQQAEKVLLSL
jgi:hypothetical protein